jgi:2-dehydropantoate 2-reductase
MNGTANLENPRIAVVGSGAIGCNFGGCLAEAGVDVRFLMRKDLEAVRSGGLSVQREHAPSFCLDDVQCYGSTEQIGPCDMVLVCLKTTDNDVLPALLPPLLMEDTVILTLQNGLGNVEFLQRNFGPERVLGGLVFMGINRVGPGRIVNFNPNGGTVTIGEPFTAVTERL